MTRRGKVTPTMKKDLTFDGISSYSHDMMPTVSAERIIFEIEVLRKRLDELTKRITPLLNCSANNNQHQQILIKRTAYSITWADFLRIKSHQITGTWGKVGIDDRVKMTPAQSKTGPQRPINFSINLFYLILPGFGELTFD